MKQLIAAFTFIFITCFFAKAGGDDDFTPSDEATHIPAMILVDDGSVDDTIAELEGMGVIVLYHRENILLSMIPVESLDAMRQKRKVKKVERGRKWRPFEPTMDVARTFNDAYKIHEGIDIPQPFDGTGVVVGVCDIGIDTRHPNFKTSDGKECRIRLVTQYREEQGLRTVYSTPEEIYDWETDDAEQWHATHVTGIAAGGYKANGYQGMAPGADIVFSSSQLSDVGLLAGVEDIIAYARSVGKPAVVNLSMGSNVGPRDGSSLFTRYLDLCTEDAVICISAGNEGNKNCSLQYDFTETSPRVEVQTSNWDGLKVTGVVDVWGEDDSPFKIGLFIRDDRDDSRQYFELQDFSNPETGVWRVSADKEDPDYNEMFARYYNGGYLEIYGGKSSLNGRMNATAVFELTSDITSDKSPTWARYWHGLVVEGEAGSHVDITCGSGSFLGLHSDIGNTLSISDLATGFKTISVGMTNNRSSITFWGDNTVTNSDPEGEVNKNSSYGTLMDGRILPTTCAPGAWVVSSLSAPYFRLHPERLSEVVDIVNIDGRDAYWTEDVGTSMSTPYVAGTIATWLQAYPSLKAADAKRIVEATNRVPALDPQNRRNGLGWFDPFEGIKMVLEEMIASNPEIEELQGVKVAFANGVLQVANLSGGRIMMEVYSVDGRRRHGSEAGQGYSTIDLSGMEKGVYIVNITGPTALRKMEKIFVR